MGAQPWPIKFRDDVALKEWSSKPLLQRCGVLTTCMNKIQSLTGYIGCSILLINHFTHRKAVFFTSSQRLDRSCGPPSLLSAKYRASFGGDKILYRPGATEKNHINLNKVTDFKGRDLSSGPLGHKAGVLSAATVGVSISVCYLQRSHCLI